MQILKAWSDNKVRELATVCLPWQYLTKALEWFDDVDISAFLRCVIVDLWQSLSVWHLLLSAKIRKIVRANHRLTVRRIAEQVNIERETVRKILTEDLDMRKVCAKMVPKELTHRHCL
jgi:hypothetical protein